MACCQQAIAALQKKLSISSVLRSIETAHCTELVNELNTFPITILKCIKKKKSKAIITLLATAVLITLLVSITSVLKITILINVTIITFDMVMLLCLS